MDSETILSRIKKMSSPRRAALFDAAKNLADQSKLMLFLSLAATDGEKIVDALLLPNEDDELEALISAVVCRSEADAMATATASYQSTWEKINIQYELALRSGNIGRAMMLRKLAHARKDIFDAEIKRLRATNVVFGV
tara:strand:- start:492 stop:905 length:414 start_codon:yes stop_codon:yes gene_type:complete